MAILMKADGSRAEIEQPRAPGSSSFWTLDEILSVMGGRWRILRHKALPTGDYFVLLQTKPEPVHNAQASIMMGCYISGDVLLLENGREMR